MATSTNKPTSTNLLKWFDSRGRDVGTWAFVLNRITALGLVFYLFLHLIVLGQLAQGPEAYDGFLSLIKHPVFIFSELLVVIAGIYHGLNGIRIGITSFSNSSPAQKQIFYVMLAITIICSLIFAIRMFTA